MSDIAEVHFCVSQPVAAAVAGFLLDEVGAGFEQRDSETLGAPADGAVEFVVWMPETAVDEHVDAIKRLLDSLREMGDDISTFKWHQVPCAADGWVDAYKKHFKLSRVGRQFVIKPSWEDYTPEAGEHLIEIDPGMAFGTGAHASTSLALRAIQRANRSLAPKPKTVIDVGGGTGILAIAAAKLWPRCEVVAIDSDPIAVQVCEENVSRNGLSSRIQCQQGTAGAVSGRYDFVLANLSYDVLSDCRENLVSLLTRGGRLVLSGLLIDQAKELSRLYAQSLDVEPEYTEDEDEWRCVLLRIPPGS